MMHICIPITEKIKPPLLLLLLLCGWSSDEMSDDVMSDDKIFL